MNEHQDTADQTGADAAAETPEAPKKRRAPRKTAAAAAAPVDVVTSDAAAATDAVAPVVKKPRAPRKAAVADAGTPAIPMLVDAQEPVTPAVRPSRSRKKDVPEALEAPAAETSSSVAVAVLRGARRFFGASGVSAAASAPVWSAVS
jgi:hypothetical protein